MVGARNYQLLLSVGGHYPCSISCNCTTAPGQGTIRLTQISWIARLLFWNKANVHETLFLFITPVWVLQSGDMFA